ncbi:hypothetical protein [Ekhidna sp.]|uniref:hypothetical protein n=1 Tax=Ekhidna sp. TaxID=2608089 RepID=UPI003BAB3A57
MRQYLKIFLIAILGLSTSMAFSQEYDDLYFTKKDRVKKQKKNEDKEAQSYQNQPSNDKELSFLGRQYQYNAEVSGDVSEESLDYYEPERTQEDYRSDRDYTDYNSYDNQNYSDPQASYDNTSQQPVVINNYYNDNWNDFNRWNRPRFRFGMGWNSWGGNFWSVSYGNAWGNPWYDPFWDPWGWNAGWGWNRGWGWNAGWGWNSWAWGGGFYNSLWCPPVYYGNYYRRPVYLVDNNSRRGRGVVRGARPSRGSVSSRESRSSSGRRVAATTDSNNGRSYSRQQADYLNRSRAGRIANGNSRSSSSINSRSSSSINNSRSTNSNSRFNSSRQNSNSNYGRSSNSSRTRSYSPPASSGRSSSGRSSSVRSSGSSRSSGSVGRSSRSSGSRSSGSRSSSGRSSSGRRGGN